MEAHLAQIERLNPALNAIVTLDAERALHRAVAADEAQARGEVPGPLHGLAGCHKDLQPTAGMRTTLGSRIFKDFIPEEDSLLVERIRRAGAIALGKTNTPEFGAGSQTYNEVFGATLNPWDTTKTCGGSSGGAAVALACGMVRAGRWQRSGRIVAQSGQLLRRRGIASFAGARARVAGPHGVDSTSVEGPMARSVEDLALFLSAIAGPDPRAPLSLADPTSFRQPLERISKAPEWPGGKIWEAFLSIAACAK